MKLGRLAVLSVFILGASLLASSLGVVLAQDGEQTDRPIVFIQAEGAVTPAMVNYVQRGVRIAQGRNAAALISRLDTPGGQVDIRKPRGR